MTNTFDFLPRFKFSLRSEYESFVITSYRKPAGKAPEGPEVILASPAAGLPSILMPFALISSSHEMKQSAADFNIFQPIGLGSPHERPAIIVFISPYTLTAFPSSLSAERKIGSASAGSTTIIFGGLSSV